MVREERVNYDLKKSEIDTHLSALQVNILVGSKEFVYNLISSVISQQILVVNIVLQFVQNCMLPLSLWLHCHFTHNYSLWTMYHISVCCIETSLVNLSCSSQDFYLYLCILTYCVVYLLRNVLQTPHIALYIYCASYYRNYVQCCVHVSISHQIIDFTRSIIYALHTILQIEGLARGKTLTELLNVSLNWLYTVVLPA